MGATRKLQGEIDRVLKKVQEGVDVFDSIWNKVYDTDNANQKEKFEADLKKEIKKLQRYRDQIKTWIQSSEIKDKKALMDARKCIEREMERFKVCEKETKTKAFSKEGLGQQPKTDPKEKAKSETREWVNNLVGELDTQIDHFEAEIEGLSVKKGKTRPPRLTHLEASIGRHKLHIMKLEAILRLLDNDQLSPEQVNELKDLVEDYVERNQENFEEFSDVDDIYSSLPLDKVDTLEDLGPSALVKGVTSVSGAGAILGLKTSLATSPSHASSTSAADLLEDNASQDSNSDVPPRTPRSKSIALPSSVSSNPSGMVVSASPTGVGSTAGSGSVASHGLAVGTSTSSVISGTGQARGNAMTMENANSTTLPSPVKDDDTGSIPGHRPSPALSEIGLSRGIGRGSLVGIGSTQSSNVPLSPGNGFHSNGALSTASGVADITKTNVVGADDRSQSLASPLTGRLQGQQIPKATDGNSNDSNAVGDNSVIGGRVFSTSGVSGVHWRHPSANSFPSQNEMLRARAEIPPDHREQFLQRLHHVQQVQQAGHDTLLGMPKLGGGSQSQYALQQQSPLLQQNSSSNQVGRPAHSLGGISGVSSSSLTQQIAMQSQNLISPGSKDVNDSGAVKIEDQQQLVLADDFKIDHTGNQILNQSIINEDDSKTLAASDLPVGGPASLPETSQASRDVDLSSGQPLQLNQPPGSLGVIGRRSVSDLGAIGDNLGASSAPSTIVHDHAYNLQLLDAAYSKLPLPKDSERPKSYIPKHPTSTPAFYPQAPAPIFDNPTFWDRLGSDNFGTDILFFAFYYQQNTYQQYLAARELKRHSWRYHRKYNTWFQRHEEPLVTNEEYEQGTYVYFDYQVPNDESKQGWCQRIKTEFTFEYSFLEDELM